MEQVHKERKQMREEIKGKKRDLNTRTGRFTWNNEKLLGIEHNY